MIYAHCAEKQSFLCVTFLHGNNFFKRVDKLDFSISQKQINQWLFNIALVISSEHTLSHRLNLG